MLNYHEINPPDGYTIYDQTPTEADAQLAYLQANGYQSINLEQYQTWLTTGTLPVGVTKPVLITVDDGLVSEQAWDPLLAKHGFTAVMFVVTGFADNKTPGSIDDPNQMTWAQIQALAADGRWEIAFHAGQYGHGDFSDGTTEGRAPRPTRRPAGGTTRASGHRPGRVARRRKRRRLRSRPRSRTRSAPASRN